jgi:tRNA(Arg) A34 adenosine deaminase TadA
LGSKAAIDALSQKPDGGNEWSAFLQEFKLTITSMQVPNDCPTEEDEWAESNAVWPMQLHINSIHKLKERAQLCGKRKRQLLGPEELAGMEKSMGILLRHVADAAVRNDNTPLCSSREGKSRELCPASMGMIVDPLTSEVLVTSDFAHSEDGPRHGNSHFCDARPPSFHPLGHAAMRCIEVLARKQHVERAVREGERESREEDPPLPNAAASVSSGAKEVDTTVPYLANGYDYYTTVEPCVMCSMALLHSRIRCVMFGVDNPKGGGLVTHMKLHTLKSLNHHFQVFRGVLPKQCVDAEGLQLDAAAE